ncbi:glycosyltransferase [Nocardia inohanensis]|uniref:glycosyltransferase n=1 Tax=Nocardia inohanensis TaxID=209246 RepID=UPI00082EA8CF|nr:glycosyltransferase [Nocardia inohanensis]
MRLIIIAVGTHGDVAPLVGLGVGLQAAGHDVAFAAHPLFEDLVTGCGLEYLYMAPGFDFDPDNPRQHEAELSDWVHTLRVLSRGVIDAVRDQPADALLTGMAVELASFSLAELKSIPVIGLRFFPTGDFGHGPMDPRAAAAGHAVRAELGLPEIGTAELESRFRESEKFVLYGFSAHVIQLPPDWPPDRLVAGYWWTPRPLGWEPPAALTEFLAAGPPPVFIGFGSTTDGVEHRADLSAIVAAALRRAGVRGIVQSGWLRLDVEDADVLTIGNVPHDWLFPRMAAVVHHCGAGTTAAGLRAGVPAVAIPGGVDQPYWAQRLLDLGVSPRTIPLRDLTADALADALRAATTDPELRANAARLGALIDSEDGIGTSVKAIEAHLAADQSDSVANVFSSNSNDSRRLGM